MNSSRSSALEVHHAVLCIGEGDATERLLGEFLGGEVREGNPDVYVERIDRFGIENARALRARVSGTALAGNIRLFAICARSIPADAQNALLKLFEEPPEGVRFFLSLPNERSILPTLRSRFHVIHSAAYSYKGGGGQSGESDLLSGTLGEVLRTIQSSLKRGNTENIPPLLVKIENEIHQNPALLASIGDDLMLVSEHFGRSGASAKMLLEHIILSRAEAPHTQVAK